MKMFFDPVLTGVIIKIPGIQWKNGYFQTLLQILKVNAADTESLIANDLRRRKFDNLIEQLFFTVQFRDLILSEELLENRIIAENAKAQ